MLQLLKLVLKTSASQDVSGRMRRGDLPQRSDWIIGRLQPSVDATALPVIKGVFTVETLTLEVLVGGIWGCDSWQEQMMARKC